jgi:hypothetical protein
MTLSQLKIWAVWQVVFNWRIRRRLPRICEFARSFGYVLDDKPKGEISKLVLLEERLRK